MTTRTLTGIETLMWEDGDARTRESFRREVRAAMNTCNPGTAVEVRSHDGVTLDAWVVS